METYLTELLCLVQNLEGGTPSDVAVQWYLQRVADSTPDLGALEVFDSLS